MVISLQFLLRSRNNESLESWHQFKFKTVVDNNVFYLDIKMHFCGERLIFFRFSIYFNFFILNFCTYILSTQVPDLISLTEFAKLLNLL